MLIIKSVISNIPASILTALTHNQQCLCLIRVAAVAHESVARAAT
jgi:hypothetical protein